MSPSEVHNEQPPDTSARARLSAMTSATSVPTLTSDELDAILNEYATVDRFGIWPNDTSWEETYDFNAAAAEGWHRKAGKVIDQYDFHNEQQRFFRSQQYANCITQAKRYADRVVSTVSTSAPKIINDPLTWPFDRVGI